MTYDCFLFNDEWTQLAVRMVEISRSVDKFVICESNVSMRGNRKTIQFWDNRAGFDMNKFIHVGLHTDSYAESREANCAFETRMRAHLNTVLDPILSDNDVVCFGDADEIPRATALQSAATAGKPVRLGMPFFYYYFNLRVGHHAGHTLNMNRPIVAPYRFFRQHGFNAMRWSVPVDTVVPDGGWHFSFLGGYDALLRKISCHAEGASSDWLLKEDRATIERRIAEGKLYDGSAQYEFVPVDETFPESVVNNYAFYCALGLVKPVGSRVDTTSAKA